MGEPEFEKTLEQIKDFYTSEEGEATFKQFASKWIDKFEGDGDAESQENKLEYTEAYNEFLGLFEGKLHQIASKHGYQDAQFAELLKKHLEGGDEGVEMFVYFTKAITDFTSFVEMMIAYKGEIEDS